MMTVSRMRLVQTFMACTAAFLVCSAGTQADEVSDIGYIDQAALSNVRPFSDVGRQISDYKSHLDAQLAVAMKSAHGDADKQRLVREFQDKLSDRQRRLLEPLLRRAQTAIASVASSKNLSVIVDKRIIIVGGQDVTQNVIDLVTGVGDPVPPVSTPPPSSVGFVDQAQIDAVPKLKMTMDEVGKFGTDEEQHAQTALRTAKTDDERRGILKEYQKRIGDERKQLVDPLIDQTRGIIAKVAQRKKLILVIDRGDLLYGGTDITGDVVKELGG